MKRPSPGSRASHERWLVSYADFITLLFAFFVVLYAFAKADEKKQAAISAAIANAFRTMAISDASAAAQTDAATRDSPIAAIANAAASPDAADLALGPSVQDDLQTVRQKLENSLSWQVKNHLVALQMTPDGLVVSLREAGFFDSASAVPKPGTELILHEIAASLAHDSLAIRVEGHTDNLPIHSSLFDSNWELSSARATRIARILVEEDGIGADRVSAAGYAGYHPVATNATPDGRAANRRVDLVLLPRIRLTYGPQDASSNPAWRRVTDN